MKTKKIVLGFQHLLAMFGATVLVPILTGLNPSLALLSAGIGTLIFHLTTKLKVPVFLGSSFAFIGAISIINKSQGIAAVKGGIIFAGLVYILLSLITYKVGVEKIQQFFPKIVVGPIIIVIGLRLAPVAINMATLDSNGHYSLPIIIISLSVLITMIIISILEKGFFKLVPIIVSIFIGFIVALILQSLNLYHIPNLTVLKEAGWLGLPKDAMKHLLTLPKFTASGIVAIAPIALVVFVEHIGDITTNGTVVGKNFLIDPGLHRTILGDGFATIAAGVIGGPANTTYAENTGVLAITKVYDPSILRIAAVFAILLSLCGKFGAFLQVIPSPIMGGVSTILFGMIASIGLRTLLESDLDFSHSKNLIISSVILVFGIGISALPVQFMNSTLEISGLTLAALSGVILNQLLPDSI